DERGDQPVFGLAGALHEQRVEVDDDHVHDGGQQDRADDVEVAAVRKLEQQVDADRHCEGSHQHGERRALAQQPGGVRVGEFGFGAAGAHQFAPENSLRRPMIQRATMLTTRVMANRMSPVAISRLMFSPNASGNRRAMFAAMVPGFDGVSTAKVMPPDADSTMATAMVSPSARPRPSMEAETTPGRPKGSTAVRIISHRVAPSASAASSCSTGVCRNTSRLSAVMIGSTMTASTIA